MAFETRPNKRGTPTAFAMLNEAQASAVLTLMRNTETVSKSESAQSHALAVALSRSVENADSNTSREEWAEATRLGFWVSDRDVSGMTGQSGLVSSFLELANAGWPEPVCRFGGMCMRAPHC